MKLNRRGFIGFSAGAAIAGPTVAQSAVSSGLAKNSQFIDWEGQDGSGICAASDSEADWKRERARELVRAAYGKFNEREKASFELYGQSDFAQRAKLEEIECLRSVSSAAKYRMADAYYIRREKVRRRKRAIYDLRYELQIPEALWETYLDISGDGA